MPANNARNTDQKLDTLIELMRFSLAIELSKCGVSQPDIAKKLHVATKSVNVMLKGLKKEKGQHASKN